MLGDFVQQPGHMFWMFNVIYEDSKKKNIQPPDVCSGIVGNLSVHDLRQVCAGVDLLVAEVMAERPVEANGVVNRNRRMSANLLSRSDTERAKEWWE